MESKLEKLAEEKGKLAARIAELESEKTQIKAAMVADPLGKARTLAASYTERQVQADACNERLAQITAEIEAEQKRINSPEVQRGIKRAGEMIAASAEVRQKVIKQLEAMQAEVNAALEKDNEAAQLLRIGGRKDTEALGAVHGELGAISQMIGGYMFARMNAGVYTATIKQAEADKQKRREATEAEAVKVKAEREAEEKRAASKHGLRIFSQVRN